MKRLKTQGEVLLCLLTSAGDISAAGMTVAQEVPVAMYTSPTQKSKSLCCIQTNYNDLSFKNKKNPDYVVTKP